MTIAIYSISDQHLSPYQFHGLQNKYNKTALKLNQLIIFRVLLQEKIHIGNERAEGASP